MSTAILHYSRMDWPTNWEVVFGRSAPLLLEIGFGSGHFLVDWANRRPEANIVGIEISLPSLRKGQKKMLVASVENLRILQGDSFSAVWLLFQTQSIEKVVINFPDPWPKAAHQNRRLINGRFLNLLATRMQNGSLLNIATDHDDYAAAIEADVSRSSYFDNRLSSPFLTKDDSRLKTKYENIAIAEGRVCRYFKYIRNSQIAPNSFINPEVVEMPHVVLSRPISVGEIGRRFTPFHVKAENINIKYLDAYQSLDKDMLLVDVYVSEEPYHQRINLSVRSRKEDDIVVSIHPTGFPRPTPGLHLAIYHFLHWLKKITPQISILTSTLNNNNGL